MGQRKVFNRQTFKMANRGERIAMGVPWTQSEWEWVVGHSDRSWEGLSDRTRPSATRRRANEHPNWVGSEATYQSEHASSGQAGLLANGKKGLRGQERGRKLALGFG